MTYRISRVLAICLVLAGPVACDSGVTGSSTVFGDYALRTVNGSSLPYTSVAGTVTTVTLDGVISLYQGLTFAESSNSRIMVNGQVTNETKTETGNWTVLGTSVSLRGNGGTTRVAIVNGKTMTIVEHGKTSVYSK